MTHTPAPWKVTRTGDRVITGEKFIADCDGGAEREDENKANATLIAAAPELLDFIKRQCAQFRPSQFTTSGPIIPEWVSEGYALIAKATGGAA